MAHFPLSVWTMGAGQLIYLSSHLSGLTIALSDPDAS